MTLKYILDKYDLHNYRRMPVEIPNMGRNDLAGLFAELGYQVGAEIGTEQGKFAQILCEGIPNLRLYCVDAWRVYAPDYRDHLNQEKLERYRLECLERLAPYPVEIVQTFSMDAVQQFEDGGLDFVYIDANHEYPYVTQDIIHWSRKVRAGGIVAGHDYYETKGKNSRCHVLPAVQGYTRAYKIMPWFVIGTKAKTPGVVRDQSRSWMFVKE